VAGILTATDPLFTAVLALWLIRSEAPDRRRTAGLIIGFVGVVALLGIDLRGSAMELLGAGAVILSALGYASAALLYRRWLADQTALAITALMTVISGLALFLGVGLLGERLTIGAIAGLVLIAVGAWLATRRQAVPSTDADSGTGRGPGDEAIQPRRARVHLHTADHGSLRTPADRGNNRG
jgi:drug/metabolite transporter (DMT)-like permease